MSDWTSGYIAEIDYTHGYYRELNSNLLQFSLLSRGIAAHAPRPLRYLELGFGQGLSLAIHAAACPGEYWGTDFNPAHAANARELIAAAGVKATILDSSFAELAARDDLPEFDVIALHGIWSWVSDENRGIIIDIVRRKLAVGGLLYISYNCTPGWSAAMPLRHLMTLHAELAGADEMGITRKIDSALAFTQQVVDAGAAYFKANPAVAERLKSISGQNRNYLAHEYFNRDWHPMPFSQVAELFAAAKLDFAASANLLDHVDPVNLSPEMQQLLQQINQPVLRESVRDYLINSQFRKDIFVKGGRKISSTQQFEMYQEQHFVMMLPIEDVSLKLTSTVGEITMQEEVYRPLLQILAEKEYAPKGFKEILAHPAWESRPVNTLVQALIILIGAGHASTVQNKTVAGAARAACTALNTHLCQHARYSHDVAYLASPLIGGGVSVSRFQQLFLLARAQGKKQPAEWAAFVWQILESQGQRIIKDGKTLEAPEDNLAELTAQAKEFDEKRVPILKMLAITN